jgi:drug/metabolite transporter (DMT)-like permease
VAAEKMRVILLMLLAVAAVAMGEAMLSKGMKETNAITGDWWVQARALLRNPHVIGGTLLMATYFGLYMTALKYADFSFVLPLSALSYLLGAVLAKCYLGETVTPTRWIGTLVITAGVVIVGLGDAGATKQP